MDPTWAVSGYVSEDSQKPTADPRLSLLSWEHLFLKSPLALRTELLPYLALKPCEAMHSVCFPTVYSAWGTCLETTQQALQCLGLPKESASTAKLIAFFNLKLCSLPCPDPEGQSTKFSPCKLNCFLVKIRDYSFLSRITSFSVLFNKYKYKVLLWEQVIDNRDRRYREKNEEFRSGLSFILNCFKRFLNVALLCQRRGD